jgi:hypothetical protein
MEPIINDVTNILFDVKDKLDDGTYLKLMNNMKQLHKMRHRNVGSKPKRYPRTINLILKAWINNEEGGTANGSLSTVNGNLYSYNVTIGYTRHDEIKCVVDQTANGIGFVSMTTSCHVGKARRYCIDNGIMMSVIDGSHYVPL